MRNRLPSVILAATIAATIAGCTTTSAGTPMPDPTSSTENTGTSASPDNGDLPSDGAPKVTNPIDVSHFEQNPCDALTPAQATGLKVGGPQRADTNFGRGCIWSNPETAGSVSVDFSSEDKRGLSSAYRSDNNGEFTYFEPIDDVEGHPAVAYDINSEHPTLACFVAVGVTDELTFSTSVALSSANIGHKDPCELSAIVAGMMLKNMQGGS